MEEEEQKINVAPAIPSVPLGMNGKDGFGAKAEAWAGRAERQTSATAVKHGSVSEGKKWEAVRGVKAEVKEG